MGGYAHVLTSIPLDIYRQALMTSCGHLHQIMQGAHKPGLVHLYSAVLMLEHRCKASEGVLDSQLRSMGSSDDWEDFWKFPQQNPFSVVRQELPERVITMPTEDSTTSPANEGTQEEDEFVQFMTNTNDLRMSTGEEMPSEAGEIDNWPARFTLSYITWCREEAVVGVSCCVDLLFQKPEVTNLNQLPNCDILVIPESKTDGPYYNPLFMPKEVLKPMYSSGDVSQIREHYLGQIREERFAVTMALAGGALFGSAISGILGWFGATTSSTEEVKRVNANQEHIDQVARQVALTQEFSKKMAEHSAQLESRENLTEEFLHMMVGLQSMFDHLEMITNGISVLFHNRQLSPLLVDRDLIIKEVRKVQVAERERDNLLMIAPGEVWHAPCSYVVTRDLRIHVMIHVPIGESASYRKLYRYLPTPMAFLENGTHFLANPPAPYLLLDQNDKNPIEMTEDQVDSCKMVNYYRKYCPAASFMMNRAPPSCLASLYDGDVQGVLEQCPLVVLDESFPHVSDLSFGEFTIYSHQELQVRVYCGNQPEGVQELEGLTRVSLRRDCRLVHDDFVLEPAVDFDAQDFVLQTVPMPLSEELNETLLGALDWGKTKGVMPVHQAALMGEGLTMAEMSRDWNHELMEEHSHWTWRGILILLSVSLFSLVVSCCCMRECWNAFQRHRQRQALGPAIRAEVSHEMQDLLRKQPAPSAPVASVK